MNRNVEETDWHLLLTASERARMLDDIARVSLAVGCRVFPEKLWDDLDVAASSLAFRKCPMKRLAFIQRTLPLLTRALEQMQRYPARETQQLTRSIAPPSRARRVGTQAVLSVLRRGHVERFIDETLSVPSFDTPENRAVKSFLQTLGQDCATIAHIAEAAEEFEVAAQASRCAAHLQALLAKSYWLEVPPDPIAWLNPPVHRMQSQSAYAQALLWMTRYRSGFSFNWHSPLFSLPPRESWRLYELWCFFTVLETIRTIGWQASGAAGDIIRVQEGRLTTTLSQGCSSRISLTHFEGRRLTLLYNPRYPKGELSRSYTMQPDIALMQEGKLWLLDAKFKTYALPGDEGADIAQMHSYRDAIISPDSIPNVARAWCLYAGQAGGPNRPVVAYGSDTASIVGALCLRPGDAQGFDHLCRLLTAWLG